MVGMINSAAPTFSGSALRDRRLRAGFSQSELARRASVREQQINRWERGKNVPSADAVSVLAETLSCDISDFFSVDEVSDGEDDDSEADLFEAAHLLNRAGSYALADRLLQRARQVAEQQKQLEVTR